MVERLGMKCLTFQPEDGMIRAEGHGPVICSTSVGSIGPILHFSCVHGLPKSYKTTKNSLEGNKVFIFCQEADMMRSGLLPVEKLLLRDLDHSARRSAITVNLNRWQPLGSRI